jgi:hypothetical protein
LALQYLREVIAIIKILSSGNKRFIKFYYFMIMVSGLDHPEECHGTKYTVTAGFRPAVTLQRSSGYKNEFGSHPETCEIPVKHLQGQAVSVTCIYPGEHRCEFEWNQATALLIVSFPEPVSARLFELRPL